MSTISGTRHDSAAACSRAHEHLADWRASLAQELRHVVVPVVSAAGCSTAREPDKLRTCTRARPLTRSTSSTLSMSARLTMSCRSPSANPRPLGESAEPTGRSLVPGRHTCRWLLERHAVLMHADFMPRRLSLALLEDSPPILPCIPKATAGNRARRHWRACGASLRPHQTCGATPQELPALPASPAGTAAAAAPRAWLTSSPGGLLPLPLADPLPLPCAVVDSAMPTCLLPWRQRLH